MRKQKTSNTPKKVLERIGQMKNRDYSQCMRSFCVERIRTTIRRRKKRRQKMVMLVDCV